MNRGGGGEEETMDFTAVACTGDAVQTPGNIFELRSGVSWSLCSGFFSGMLTRFNLHTWEDGRTLSVQFIRNHQKCIECHRNRPKNNNTQSVDKISAHKNPSFHGK